MALTAISVYLPAPGMEGVMLVALVFALTNLPSVKLLGGSGQAGATLC